MPDRPMDPDGPYHDDTIGETVPSARKEPMQTYVFTVAVTGNDVQDAATKVHDDLINLLACNLAPEEYDDVDVHVTESVRITK